VAERVAVIGSRAYPNLGAVARFVRSLSRDAVIVSGGASGVDMTAERWARRLGMERIIHRPAHRTFGKRAPLERNKLIVRDADRVVAFWDGVSRGTAHAIGEARKAGKPVVVIGVDGEVRDG
jgi:hypothetical protein